MRRILSFVSVLTVGVLGPWMLPPLAEADTVWTPGVLVSAPDLLADPDDWIGPVHSFPEDGYPCGSASVESTSLVKMAGDYVYVKDTCKDGRSAVARITGQEDGHWHTRICRNAYGKGTWARCNYDWLEDPEKYLASGVYNGDTGYLHFGTSWMFENG